MGKKWTNKEENIKHGELVRLYIEKNKSIAQIAKVLNIGESTVYDRLVRLKIHTDRSRKIGFNNIRKDISIPQVHSEQLSEFLGVMLGDGHLTKTQVSVTLGSKEEDYVEYVAELVKSIFGITPKIIHTRKGYSIVYFGSVNAVRWMLSMGLSFNKVKSQVGVPPWVFEKSEYVKGFLRGFFDTDGSFYKIRFGVQLCLTNRSKPLLQASRNGLIQLGYRPSRISKYHVYLTRRNEVASFFKEIKPANKKHLQRFKTLGWLSGQ